MISEYKRYHTAQRLNIYKIHVSQYSVNEDIHKKILYTLTRKHETESTKI